MTIQVLLIEDNEQNRYLVTYLLEKQNYQVTPAVDGPQGIATATTQTFDLILLDIQLPSMDGYTVARALRARSVETPIIAVTSYAMVGDRENALAAGCNGYIEKPINPASFVSEISHFLPRL